MAIVYEEMMIRYLERSCSTDEEAAFREWLMQSEENRKLFYETKAVWNYYNAAQSRTEEQLDKAATRLNNSLNRLERGRKRKEYFHLARYAAIFLLVLSTGVLVWTSYNHFYGGPELITVQVALTDSSKLVTLDDGSKIWLNRNSSLTYPAKFSEEERAVIFSGEAYFEVKHDARRPFKVKTANVQVKVLGTSFNLRAYASEGKTETVLMQGKVAVQNNNGENLAVLAPGQMARYDNAGRRLSVRNVDAAQYALWRYGTQTFSHATLYDITQKLSELYRVRFAIDGLVDRSAVYNFSFNKGESIDSVMQMLCFIAPVKYEKKESEIRIIPR
jgi:transmembrane sensor